MAGCMTLALSNALASTVTDTTTATATGSMAPIVLRLVPLEVRVNGVKGGSWALLEKDDELHATDDAFQEWRIERRADQPGLRFRGQTWYPLKAVDGYTFRFDPVEQSVDIVFSAEAFSATRLGRNGRVASADLVTTPTPAAFLNIDANVSRQSAQGTDTTADIGALTETGLATRWGVLTTSHVMRRAGGLGQGATATRLETSFVRDFQAHNLTLRVGDTLTRSGMWGGSLYFGGVQLSRNFALTPGFVTQPIPSLVGTSSTPSTVSVYVNDVLRQTSNLPPGPFAIDNFPLLTGGGQARLVVRDLLGRETVVEQSFFTHASLLEPGLSDWSVETGAMRRNLGSESADYGESFASGLWRRGVTPRLTLDAQLALGRTVRNAGLGATFALPWQALGQAGLRVSSSTGAGNGSEWLLSMEADHRRHGFALRGVGRSDGFRTLDTGDATRSELSAGYSYASDRMGVTGLALTRLRSRSQGNVSTLGASHAIRVGGQGSLSLNITRVMAGSSSVLLGVSLNLPLGPRTTLSSAVSSRKGQLDAYTSVSRSPEAEMGVGWRVLAGQRNNDAYGEAGFYRQGSRWLLTGNASGSRQQQTVRLGAQGGLVWMDGRLFTSRYLQDSFALVEVPGHADVGVGFQGSFLTRTDERGQALLPRLMPYQRNSIRLNPTELPISAELDDIEQVVVPPWRSGVKVVFPVRSGRGALLRIELDDGQPAPAGAVLTLPRDAEVFHVARRGEVFATGLAPVTPLQLHWKGAVCDFVVTLPAGNADSIPRIGPIPCKGVPR